MKYELIVFCVIIICGAVFGSLPNENVDDRKSAIKNIQTNIKTNVVLENSQVVVHKIGEKTKESTCNSPNSRECITTNSLLRIYSIVFPIIIIAIIILGFFGFYKWIMNPQ